ncbi:uncharacterized protein TNCV_762161 [Trichonephila clavipes]|nr:uncharacterized protein TNCV_762161 [Trichonephila clavipes]
MPPTEHVWDLVGQRLARDLRPAASKDELLLSIQALWNSLPQADIQNLFDSMPRRIAIMPDDHILDTPCQGLTLTVLKPENLVSGVLLDGQSESDIQLEKFP